MTDSRVFGGRYVLAEVLGTGGMATVWRAHDQVLGREVAIKVLSQQFAADPGFAARFEREARHAASVSHPRLVTVFDSGIDRGTPFLVMELVTGRTLRQVLDETGPLPAGQAVAIAAGVCEGLEAVHAAGLVHRDIKPANIMLAGGEVKILDFGIARAGGTAARTTAGTVLGTPAYLSPEQAGGHPAGPASDLYSLGCVLFEMLTGSPPFTAESQLALAYRQVYDDPGPPSARRPGLPASLDQLTAWLLAKAPRRPPGQRGGGPRRAPRRPGPGRHGPAPSHPCQDLRQPTAAAVARNPADGSAYRGAGRPGSGAPGRPRQHRARRARPGRCRNDRPHPRSRPPGQLGPHPRSHPPGQLGPHPRSHPPGRLVPRPGEPTA